MSSRFCIYVCTGVCWFSPLQPPAPRKAFLDVWSLTSLLGGNAQKVSSPLKGNFARSEVGRASQREGGKRCSFWTAGKTTCSEQPRHQAGYPRTRKSVPLVTREEAAGPSAGGSRFGWPVHSTAGWKLPISQHTGFNINKHLLYTVRERSHPELLNQA